MQSIADATSIYITFYPFLELKWQTQKYALTLSLSLSLMSKWLKLCCILKQPSIIKCLKCNIRISNQYNNNPKSGLQSSTYLQYIEICFPNMHWFWVSNGVDTEEMDSNIFEWSQGTLMSLPHIALVSRHVVPIKTDAYNTNCIQCLFNADSNGTCN